MADEIRPTPRSPIFGLFSDLVNVPLQYMSAPQRTQQMQGLAALIRSTGVPYTLENLSYDPSGRGLFTGAGGLGGTTRLRPEAVEAAMTVAPMVGPAARVAGRGAMAVGRAGERYAEQVVPQIMERGGLPAQLLEDLSKGSRSYAIPDISKQDIQSSAESLAEQLNNLGFQAKVIHSGSRAGPSSYVEIYDPFTGRKFEKQVRFSGHGKGPFEAAGVIDIQDIDLDSQKIIEAANQMRLLGPSQGFKFQEVLDAKANELIANGMKPRTAYNAARKFLEDQNAPIEPLRSNPIMYEDPFGSTVR